MVIMHLNDRLALCGFDGCALSLFILFHMEFIFFSLFFNNDI